MLQACLLSGVKGHHAAGGRVQVEVREKHTGPRSLHHVTCEESIKTVSEIAECKIMVVKQQAQLDRLFKTLGASVDGSVKLAAVRWCG